MIVLDTDYVSLLQGVGSAERELIQGRLRPVPDAEKATTIISFEEQMRGWLAYLARGQALKHQIDAYRRLRRQLLDFCRIQVLEFDERAATEFQRLRKARVRVGTMDLEIAAIVLAHDGTLLSRNLGDFRQVPGLRVEDWTK